MSFFAPTGHCTKLEIGPLRSRKVELKVTVTRPVQLKSSPLQLERFCKDLVKVTFTKSEWSHLSNFVQGVFLIIISALSMDTIRACSPGIDCCPGTITHYEVSLNRKILTLCFGIINGCFEEMG